MDAYATLGFRQWADQQQCGHGAGINAVFVARIVVLMVAYRGDFQDRMCWPAWHLVNRLAFHKERSFINDSTAMFGCFQVISLLDDGDRGKAKIHAGSLLEWIQANY